MPLTDLTTLVDQKIIELIGSIKDSPEFIENMLSQTHIEKNNNLISSMIPMVNHRADKIIEIIKEAPYDDDEDSMLRKLPQIGLNEGIKRENDKIKDLIKKIS